MNSDIFSRAILITLGLLIGFCVIFLRWVVHGRLANKRLGYRVIRIGPGQYVYEEKNAEGVLAQPPFLRHYLWAFGVGTPRPVDSSRQLGFRCTEVGLHRTIHLPPSGQWNYSVEEWARDRRDEIALRIKDKMVETFGSANVLESDEPNEPV